MTSPPFPPVPPRRPRPRPGPPPPSPAAGPRPPRRYADPATRPDVSLEAYGTGDPDLAADPDPEPLRVHHAGTGTLVVLVALVVLLAAVVLLVLPQL